MHYGIDDEDSPFISISEEEYAAMQAEVQQAKSQQAKSQQAKSQQAKLRTLVIQQPSLQEAIEPDFHRLYKEARTWQSKLSVIQAAYKSYLPSILSAARTGRSIDPNIVEWEFTRIEDFAWCEIRALGLPFYPQFPVLNYFADFADPLRKIVIELDGKKFHNKQKDDARDKRMRDDGWEIHRITSKTAERYLDDVFSVDEAYEIKEAIGGEHPFSIANRAYLEMAKSTIDGYLLVLRRRHYVKD
jgi:very-short-patch-repair endonuclease